MGLYGDKLTKTDGSGVDKLTKSTALSMVQFGITNGSGIDNLTKSVGTAQDNLTKSAGTAFDGLTKSPGTPIDNIVRNYILINEDCEGPDSGGLLLGWICATGIPTIEDNGINGKSQLIEEDLLQDLAFQKNFSDPIVDGTKLKLTFKFRTNSDGTLDIYQVTGDGLIHTVDLSSVSGVQNVSVDFIADRMTGILFLVSDVSTSDYIMYDDILLEVHKQDNLTYGV